MAIKKVQLPDNSTQDINDSRIGSADITKWNAQESFYFVQGSSSAAGNATSGSYLSTKWEGTVSGITTPTDGMKIAFRIATNTGVATAGAVLSIDGGTTYKPVVFNVNSVITTRYSVGSTLLLVYNSTQTATAYLTSNTKSTVTGCWQIMDYSASNTDTKVRQYQSGANAAGTSPEYPLLSRYGTTNADSSYEANYARFHTGATLNTTTGGITATSFKKTGGTSSQFLKADGSVDSNTYLTTAPVTSVNGSTGDVTVSVPTKTSDLTNDSGFITDVSGKEDKSNKVTSLSSASSDTQYPSAKVVYDELEEKVSSTSYDSIVSMSKTDFDALATKDSRTFYIVDDPNGEISQPIGIASVTQTTESTVSGGTNVITVTKTDGTSSTFNVKNGDKGDKGDPGPKGDTGDTGPAGASGVASSDGITSINNLLANVPDDTASTVYVAGAKEVKSINDVIRVDKAEVGEDNLYDGQKYTGAPWTGFISQDYIDFYASPGKTYVVDLGVNETPEYPFFAFFDASDNYISNTTRIYTNGVATVTTVADTAKVRITVSRISSLSDCYIREGTEAGEWRPHKYLKGYAHQTEVDEISETLENISNTVSFNTKNLDKKYFGTRYSGAPWSGFVQCGYIDIPREYFGERVYAWFTDPNNAATTLGFFGTVDSNGTVVHSPGTTFTSIAGSLFGTYRLFVWQLISDDIKFIRFTLYHGGGDFTDAMIESLFIGSDLDAEYDTFPWINERTVPPVTRDWYSGENEQIKAIESKYPTWSSELLGLTKTKNLFNNDQHTYRLNDTSMASPYYPSMISDFIPVSPSTTYCVSRNGVADNNLQTTFYNSEKTAISNTLYSVHTTPSNCAYVRIVLSNYNTWTIVSNEVKIQYEQASAPSAYISPYVYAGEVDVATTPLTGKKFAVIGDSFTIYGWPNTTAEKTGMTLLSNQAVSGARWTTNSGINSAYQQAQALVSGGYNPDYILVFLGCNDVENSITLGDIVYSNTISSFDQTTFTGAMQACLNYLETNFPNAIIKIGYTPAGGTTQWGNTLSRDSYLDRMRDVCRLYQVQYLDVTICQMSMAVSSNVAYRQSAGDIHPNSAGSERIGEFIARLLLSNL